MSDTFRGYNIDLLLKIKHLGRAVVGDDALYEAAQAFTAASVGGGLYGPALTSQTPGVSVTPPQPKQASATLPIPTVANADTEPADPWEGCDVVTLKGIMQAHGLTPPRTLTVGKAISLLEAAGVTHPTQAPKAA